MGASQFNLRQPSLPAQTVSDFDGTYKPRPFPNAAPVPERDKEDAYLELFEREFRAAIANDFNDEGAE